MTDLEARAERWIEPYWNADHLLRTRDWLLELDPEASEAARLAALTHDIERHFPGGPSFDRDGPPDAPEYRCLHSERSAQIVGDWLRDEGAGDLVAEVGRLILAHELGGSADEDIVQAADSLSFLEVNRALLVRWVSEGEMTTGRALDQARWMFERIRVRAARELAQPLYDETVLAVERVAGPEDLDRHI